MPAFFQNDDAAVKDRVRKLSDGPWPPCSEDFWQSQHGAGATSRRVLLRGTRRCFPSRAACPEVAVPTERVHGEFNGCFWPPLHGLFGQVHLPDEYEYNFDDESPELKAPSRTSGIVCWVETTAHRGTGRRAALQACGTRLRAAYRSASSVSQVWRLLHGIFSPD